MSASTVQYVVVGALLCLVGWAVYTDCARFRIPNRISLAVAALYPAWVAAAWPSADPLLGLAAGAAILVLGFVLFALKLLGGGDAKLMAAIGLWAGAQFAFEFVILTTIAGGVLAVLALIYYRARAAWAPQLFVRDAVGRAMGALSSQARTATATEGGDGPASEADLQILAAESAQTHISRRPIPYGVAIAAGALALAYELLTMAGA